MQNYIPIFFVYISLSWAAFDWPCSGIEIHCVLFWDSLYWKKKNDYFCFQNNKLTRLVFWFCKKNTSLRIYVTNMASTNKVVGNENMFLLLFLLLFSFFAKQTYQKIQGRNFFLWGYLPRIFENNTWARINCLHFSLRWVKKISKEKEFKRRNAKEIFALFPFSILVIAFSAECLIFLV